MRADQNPSDLQLSRRKVLTIALVGGGALLAGSVAVPADAGSTKVSQKAVAYQGKPNGSARCDTCIQWQAPASCKVVAGVISPAGWCSIFAPKA